MNPNKKAASLLELKPVNAKKFLIKHGLLPIDVGQGKKRVDRWLESAVQAVINQLHEAAQKSKIKKPAKKKSDFPPEVSVATMSSSELFQLTQSYSLH